MKMLNNLYVKASVALGAVAMPFGVIAAPDPLNAGKLNLEAVAGTTGLKQTALPELIGSIINAVLSVLGIVLLIYIVYAGFLWMTAGGDSDNTKKAKTMIQNAIIGLVLIMASVAISNFVIKALMTAGA